MEFTIKDEATLKKYLLGAVSPSEQEAIDRWIFTDDNADELLMAIEDELIEEALDGELQGPDFVLFNKYFLAAPERQLKLKFARDLREYAKSSPSVSGTSAIQPNLADRLADFLQRRRGFAFATIALAMGGLVVSIGLSFEVIQLQQHTRSITVQLADTSTRLNESRTVIEQLQAQQRYQSATPFASSEEVLMASLTAGPRSRSATAVNTIAIVPTSRVVDLRLTLFSMEYPRYRAVLLDDDGKEVLSQEPLIPFPIGQDKFVSLVVPAPLLADGDYAVNLFGTSGSQAPERIGGSFYFRVVHQ